MVYLHGECSLFIHNAEEEEETHHRWSDGSQRSPPATSANLVSSVGAALARRAGPNSSSPKYISDELASSVCMITTLSRLPLSKVTRT